MDIHQELVLAGCTIDSHESDLYVLATPTAIALTANSKNRKFFVSDADGKRWIEIPFGFTPWWDKKIAIYSNK